MAAASSNAQDAGRSQPLNFKVVLLGEGAVGKTSLVVRYVDNKFNDKHISTLQASFLTKNINIAGRRLTLSIWDTAGQERFHALGPIYYRDSNGAILVYDITDEDSFQKVKVWVKELRKMLGNDIALCIVGNKTDLDKDRHVTVDEAEAIQQLLVQNISTHRLNSTKDLMNCSLTLVDV
jgi:Ras-related protein Rab-21